jgi:hypothetical protein
MCRIVCLSTVLTLCHRDPEAVFSMTLRWTKTCKVLDGANESGQRNGQLMPPPT